MKVLVFIDHDIICRHFVMNGALSQLVRESDVRFIFPDDSGKRLKLRPDELELGSPFEMLPISAARQQAWRWLLYSDQLRPRRGSHEAAIRTLRWRTLGWKAALLLTLGSFAPGSTVLRKMVDRRLDQLPNQALIDLLNRERPDVVLHPTVLDGVFINDLVMECSARGIPLVLAMNSWDNPSTKRAVVGRPDWLLVWGPQTADHAIRFIGLDPKRVVEFGAAQFDVYRTPPRIDRSTFCAAHGIDPAKKIALFAGSNAQTDEFAVLQALDRALDEGRLSNLAIVYRPHPWGGGGRNGARLADARFNQVVIDRTMRSYLECIGREGYSISLPDYRDTHDLLCAVDAVVSPMSTILIEAALHGKPVAVYAPTGEDASDKLTESLPMLHFSDFLALPDVLVPRTPDELIAALALLTDATEGPARGARLAKAADRFVAPFDRPWRDRIVDFLHQVAYETDRSAA